MTALVTTFWSGGRGASPPRAGYARVGALIIIAGLAAGVPGGLETAGRALADAYLQVSVFVAATIGVLYAAQGLFRTDLGVLLSRRRAWQVPIGAALGALPGCGGAIVAVTQYTRGSLSFGAVVATLTSTMGDAMFLLLARAPDAAGIVLATSLVAGIVTGYAVDAIHGQRLLRREAAATPTRSRSPWFEGRATLAERLWLTVFVPGLGLGVLGAFQVELSGSLTTAVGVTGGALALLMWAGRTRDTCDCPSPGCRLAGRGGQVITDTNFVTAWVVFAFVGYELLVSVSGVDLGALFGVWGIMVPAMAVVVGFVPGCGPQIVTTSLYLEGAVPLSAQLGNAINNDGDALFPAIAKAPKAAALATLYSAVPAVIVSYGAYALGW